MGKVRCAASAGSIVRRVREDRGMSRAKLSAKTGIGARTIYALEQGESKNFGLENYLKILDALGLEMHINLVEPQEAPERRANQEISAISRFELGNVWQLSEEGKEQ